MAKRMSDLRERLRNLEPYTDEYGQYLHRQSEPKKRRVDEDEDDADGVGGDDYGGGR